VAEYLDHVVRSTRSLIQLNRIDVVDVMLPHVLEEWLVPTMHPVALGESAILTNVAYVE
jgi:hypothetical protein